MSTLNNINTMNILQIVEFCKMRCMLCIKKGRNQLIQEYPLVHVNYKEILIPIYSPLFL